MKVSEKGVKEAGVIKERNCNCQVLDAIDPLFCEFKKAVFNDESLNKAEERGGIESCSAPNLCYNCPLLVDTRSRFGEFVVKTQGEIDRNISEKALLLYQKENLIYLNQRSGEKSDSVQGDPLLLVKLAKNTVEALRRVVEKREEDEYRDKVLCAFTFMVIAIDRELFSAYLPPAEEAFAKFINDHKSRRGGIPVNKEYLFDMVLPMCNSQLFDKMCEFFREFMERVLKNVEKREDQIREATQTGVHNTIADFIKFSETISTFYFF